MYNKNICFSFCKKICSADVRSNIAHKYKCRICYYTYYDETHRHLKTRFAEHRGISSRTGKWESAPKTDSSGNS